MDTQIKSKSKDKKQDNIDIEDYNDSSSCIESCPNAKVCEKRQSKQKTQSNTPIIMEFNDYQTNPNILSHNPL